MAVETGDIKYRLSGGSSNSDPDASLGGVMSSEAVSGEVNALFDRISGAENAAEDVEYRCIFVTNINDTDTLYEAGIYISAQVEGGATLAIGLDPAGVNEDADTIATESDAPDGVSFSTPTTAETALSLGDLDAGDSYAIWLRRTATDSAALDEDGATLRVIGDTGE